MKQDKIKQIICISESNAVDFEDRMNEALSSLGDPEIRTYDNAPFTATIIYTVARDLPESVLELLEMADGEYHKCIECPYFKEPEDKRRKWTVCGFDNKRIRIDRRACERFYIYRYKMLTEAKDKMLEQPYTVE